MDNKVVDFGPRLEFLYKVALLIEKLLCHRKISLLVVTSVLGSITAVHLQETCKPSWAPYVFPSGGQGNGLREHVRQPRRSRLWR